MFDVGRSSFNLVFRRVLPGAISHELKSNGVISEREKTITQWLIPIPYAGKLLHHTLVLSDKYLFIFPASIGWAGYYRQKRPGDDCACQSCKAHKRNPDAA